MKAEKTLPVSVPSHLLEQVAQLTAALRKQSGVNQVDETTSAAADIVLAGFDESFDDIGAQNPANAANDDGADKSDYRGLPVDVWMADGDAELRFAVKMLAPSLPEGILPQWDARTGVSFLFRPTKRHNYVEVPCFLDVENGAEVSVSHTSDLEDAVHSRHAGMRVVVLHSRMLKERSVVVCQIRSDLIQVDQKEPMYDRIADFFDVTHGRHVLFLSPQPSQFGTLKSGAWWNRRARSGRFHQVLCNLDTLNVGTHDVTSPVDGAVKNFRCSSERFYPDSWLHVCCSTRGARFEKKTVLRDCLLSCADEGSVGRLRTYKFPSACIGEVVSHETRQVREEVPGNFKLAFMRAYLSALESALSQLCKDDDRVGQCSCGTMLLLSFHSFLGGCKTSDKETGVLHVDEAGLLHVFRETGEGRVRVAGKDLGRFRPLYMCLSYMFAADAVSDIVCDIKKRLMDVCMKARRLSQGRETAFYRMMCESSAMQEILQSGYGKWVSRMERSGELLGKIAEFDWKCEHMCDEVPCDDVPDDDCGFGALLRELSSAETRRLFLLDDEFSKEVAQRLHALRKRMIPGRRCNAAKELAQHIQDRRKELAGEGDGLPVEIGEMKKRGVPDVVCECFCEIWRKCQRLAAVLVEVVVQ